VKADLKVASFAGTRLERVCSTRAKMLPPFRATQSSHSDNCPKVRDRSPRSGPPRKPTTLRYQLSTV